MSNYVQCHPVQFDGKSLDLMRFEEPAGLIYDNLYNVIAFFSPLKMYDICDVRIREASWADMALLHIDMLS